MHEKVKEIIIALIEKSQQQKAIWKKTTRSSEYFIKLAEGFLFVDTYVDTYKRRKYSITIKNENGDTITQLIFTIGSENFDLIKNLHSVAEMRYLNADKILDNMLEIIKKSEQVGSKDAEYPPKVDLPF